MIPPKGFSWFDILMRNIASHADTIAGHGDGKHYKGTTLPKNSKQKLVARRKAERQARRAHYARLRG